MSADRWAALMRRARRQANIYGERAKVQGMRSGRKGQAWVYVVTAPETGVGGWSAS